MIANNELCDGDYVSLDAARALKRIGFDVPTHTHYHWRDAEGKVYVSRTSNPETWKDYDCMVDRPILQKALEWLREKHHVSLRINYAMSQRGWFFDYLDLEDGSYDDSTSTYDNAFDYYENYNEAVNDGIIAICAHIQSR